MKISLANANIDYIAGFVSFEESYQLADVLEREIHWHQDYIAMYGKQIAVPRLQAWFGDNQQTYSYSGIQLKPNSFTTTLAVLNERVSQHCGVTFNSVLANYYRDENDSVSWHSDDESELGKNPVIASLSLGQTRIFKLKHKVTGEKYEIPLQSGDLLVMSGEMQHFWQHAILKETTKLQARINLTFRQIK
ncbi:alpha-ketoglutarate-dependent dioxygenase AlkB family protein [Thalassotalea fusca]